MTFDEWFTDMENRYHASYGGYKDLLEEAWKAGQIEALRESMGKIDNLVDLVWGVKINIEHQIEELEEEQDA